MKSVERAELERLKLLSSGEHGVVERQKNEVSSTSRATWAVSAERRRAVRPTSTRAIRDGNRSCGQKTPFRSETTLAAAMRLAVWAYAGARDRASAGSSRRTLTPSRVPRRRCR